MELKARQKFVDSFRHSVRTNKEEWDFRFRQTGYRILLSVSFFVSSRGCYERENKLVPSVGLYYSFFHLALALMCIHPNMDLRKLPKFPLDEFRKKRYGFEKFTKNGGRFVTHKGVESFLTRCVQERLISPSTLECFLDAKHLRWIANYAPTYDRPSHFEQMNKDLLSRMEICLEEVFFFIASMNKEYTDTADRYNLSSHVHDYLASFIGDGIGDDFMDGLISDEESQEVIALLVKNGLST